MSYRLTITALGRTLLDVQLGEDEPAAAPTGPLERVLGPVTDRRALPVFGFSPAAQLPRDRRPVVR